MSEGFIRKFTEEERVAIVEETLQYGSVSLVAAKHGLNPGLISNWKSNYVRYKQTLKPKEDKKESKENLPIDYKRKAKKLEEEIKEKELEIAMLRDLLKKKKRL